LDQFLNELIRRREILRPYHPHLAALGVAFLLGLTVAAFKLSTEPEALDVADRWPFPQWKPYNAGAQRDMLASASLWAEDPSKTKPVAEVKPDGPPWRFIGTFQEGQSRLAVIEIDQGKRIQRMEPGQPLPNGAIITRIEPTILTYDEDGLEKALRLFAPMKSESTAGTGKN